MTDSAVKAMPCAVNDVVFGDAANLYITKQAEKFQCVTALLGLQVILLVI